MQPSLRRRHLQPLYLQLLLLRLRRCLARSRGARAARDHGFLWRISRDGRSSYLFGTLHVAFVNPVFAAKQMVTADHVGHGRFGINLVSGWNQGEFAMFGVTSASTRRTISAPTAKANGMLKSV